MSASAFDSMIHGGLFGDEEAAACFSDAAQIAAMIRFEAALARAEARLGVIPAEEGARLAAALDQATLAPESLRAGTTSSGVPAPALVVALREVVGPDLGRWLHWGATSQDVVDTGLVLRLRGALDLIETRLDATAERLAALAEAHRKTPMAARTRWRQATPTSFGLKAALWLSPLIRLKQRLAEMRGRLLSVQFGGASGNLSALGDAGVKVMAALAEELALAPAAPWHTQRDRIEELGGWLAGVTGAFGKLGLDLILLGQSEVAEIALAQSGGSSTMPQKQNPVGPEAMVALARFNAAQVAALHQSALQAHERDGAAWTSEWLVLPQMAIAAAASARHAQASVEGLAPDAARMLANLEGENGLVYAEAASFALSARMPRAEAQALVKRFALSVQGSERKLLDALIDETGEGALLAPLSDPTAHLGSAEAMIEQLVGQWRAAAAGGD